MSKKEIKLSQSEKAVLSERDKKFDSKATAEDCVNDLRNLQEKHPLKHITRNFYRTNGEYSDATWNQFFGTFLEYRRQAGLELSRGQHQLERHIAKHASLDVYRDFYKEEVLPWHLKYERKPDNKKFKTVMVCSDLHDIELDLFVWGVFVDTVKRIQPDIIVLAGDTFDCYEFSRFDIDLRKIKILERFQFVKNTIFAQLRKAAPNAQINFHWGNHEARLGKHLADKSPAMKIILSDVMGISLADLFGLPEFEINMVAKLDLSAFNASDVNEELKENYKVYYNSFVVAHFKDLSYGISGASGHTHSPEQITTANIPSGKISWTNMGCMANTRAEYVEGMDKWMNSFLIAYIDTEKKSVVPNHILIPDNFVVVEGKRYERKK